MDCKGELGGIVEAPKEILPKYGLPNWVAAEESQTLEA
jgi:hypothetical protein